MNEFDYRWNMQRSYAEAKLPGAVREVVRLINEPRTSIAILAAAVAKHQGLAESVLRKANVSTYGMPGRVKNLNSAVVVLGFDALKQTSRSVLLASTGRKMTQAVIQHQGLWEHSIGCGVVARTLAMRSGKCNPDDAFIAGLLHDVGILFSRNPDRKTESTSLTGSMGLAKPTLDGMTRFAHAHAGADKAEEWGLAGDIAEAIRFHHLPLLATTNVFLTGVVYLAESLCHRLRVGAAEFEEAADVDEEMLAKLGVPEFSSKEALVTFFRGLVRDHVQQWPCLDDAVKELKSKLFDTLDALQEEQRLIIALHFFEGLSIAEIGQLLEMSVPSVSAHLSGALAQLQNALEIRSEWRLHTL